MELYRMYPHKCIEQDGKTFYIEDAGAESFVFRCEGEVIKYFPDGVSDKMMLLAERLQENAEILEPLHILIPIEPIIYNNKIIGYKFKYIDFKTDLTSMMEESTYIECVAYFYIFLLQMDALMQSGIAMYDDNFKNMVLSIKNELFMLDTVSKYTEVELSSKSLELEYKFFKMISSSRFSRLIFNYLHKYLLDQGEIPKCIFKSKKLDVCDYYGFKYNGELNSLIELFENIIMALPSSERDRINAILLENGVRTIGMRAQ